MLKNNKVQNKKVDIGKEFTYSVSDDNVDNIILKSNTESKGINFMSNDKTIDSRALENNVVLKGMSSMA